MSETLESEACPHCKKQLTPDLEGGSRRAKIIHLVDHALEAATGLTLRDVPDRSFWEAAEVCGETWEDAAVQADFEIQYVIDSMLLTPEDREKSKQRAMAWLNKHYRGTSTRSDDG